MRQIMSEIRGPSTQNISVNRTAIVGVDNLPAYKVESVNVFEDILHSKRIDFLWWTTEQEQDMLIP